MRLRLYIILQIFTFNKVNTAIARLYTTSANHDKNNISNDTLSAKLKATKSNKILSDSRLQAGAVPLQRRLSVASQFWLLKFSHALEIDLGLLAHTSNCDGDPRKISERK